MISRRDWSIAARHAFWTDRAGDDDCWEWRGTRDENGYGRISIGRRRERAHRRAWEEANGPIPRGLVVMHSCDNPGCVNPAHLSVGTPADNMRDKVSKGRLKIPSLCGAHKGAKNPRAKLTDKTVISIRLDERPQRLIADEHGVARSLISLIKTGRIWRHI